MDTSQLKEIKDRIAALIRNANRKRCILYPARNRRDSKGKIISKKALVLNKDKALFW